MPDYSVVEALCAQLDIALPELLQGTDAEERTRACDSEQIAEKLEQMRHIKATQTLVIGLALIALGAAMLALSQLYGGSYAEDFISGVLLGVAVAGMLVGVYVAARYCAERTAKD